MSRENLPCRLYTAEQVGLLDKKAIQDCNTSGFELMRRAGETVYQYLIERWPNVKKGTLQVFCGAGNNAGDGFIVAALALQKGLSVQVITLKDPDTLTGNALKAWGMYQDLGGQAQMWRCDMGILDIDANTVVVDALLGTGLQGEVSNAYCLAITLINRSGLPVVCVDIPSGLSADTGENCGAVVRADATISFIGLKQGMFTAEGVDYCGQILFSDLAIPKTVYEAVAPSVYRISGDQLAAQMRIRKKTAHKGNHGHLAIIGGNKGMAGAVIMAAKAALRSGVGLVTVITHPDHLSCIHTACPEVLVMSAETEPQQLAAYLSEKDAIIVGPGLGQNDWAKNLLKQVWLQSKPVLLDADALNLLASAMAKPDEIWVRTQNATPVITPHPKEASRLLHCHVNEVQKNRFKSIEKLSYILNATVVLKGAGTLVRHEQKTYICTDGNPGLAVAGTGDILSGVIGSLLAQKYEPLLASKMGVWLHATAGDDCVSTDGVVGLMATDLPDKIRARLNALMMKKQSFDNV